MRRISASPRREMRMKIERNQLNDLKQVLSWMLERGRSLIQGERECYGSAKPAPDRNRESCLNTEGPGLIEEMALCLVGCPIGSCAPPFEQLVFPGCATNHRIQQLIVMFGISPCPAPWVGRDDCRLAARNVEVSKPAKAQLFGYPRCHPFKATRLLSRVNGIGELFEQMFRCLHVSAARFPVEASISRAFSTRFAGCDCRAMTARVAGSSRSQARMECYSNRHAKQPGTPGVSQSGTDAGTRGRSGCRSG